MGINYDLYCIGALLDKFIRLCSYMTTATRMYTGFIKHEKKKNQKFVSVYERFYILYKNIRRTPEGGED